MFRKIVLPLCATATIAAAQGDACAATININVPGPRMLHLPNVQLNNTLHIRVPPRIDPDIAAGAECRRLPVPDRRAKGQRRPECRRD